MELDVSGSPQRRIEQATSAYGERVVVRWCTELADGAGPGAISPEGALVLGGRHARVLLADTDADHTWWWRVWGLRGLLYVWEDAARGPVRRALHDQAWRVREGALRVIARRRLDEDLQRLADLREDPVPRVRSAAERALVRLESSDGGPVTGR